MRVSYAVSWDILALLVLHSPPTLVLEVVKSGWTMSTVPEVKIPFTIVHTMDGAHITAITTRMQESFV